MAMDTGQSDCQCHLTAEKRNGGTPVAAAGHSGGGERRQRFVPMLHPLLRQDAAQHAQQCVRLSLRLPQTKERVTSVCVCE